MGSTEAAGMPLPVMIALISVGAALLSAVLTIAVFVLLPADHFTKPPSWRRSGASIGTIAVAVVRNLAGWLLIVLGIVLSVPGIPGQGLLTILMGLLLVDLPGKRKLELRILRTRRVLSFINRLRVRFRRAPLALP